MIGAEVNPVTNEAPSTIDRKKHLRLSGVKNKDLLEVEIIKGNKKPEYYEHLSRSLGFLDVKDMAKTAIKYNNPKRLIYAINISSSVSFERVPKAKIIDKGMNQL